MTAEYAANRHPAGSWARYVRVYVGALPWAIPPISCAALAYLLVWRRGQYLDDYWVYRYPIHLSLEARGLGAVVNELLARLLHSNEALGRVVSAATMATNSLLLGWLIKRLSGSWPAGLAAGWLLISPVWAFEGALWAAAFSYLFSTIFLLLHLNAAWGVISGKSRARRMLALGAASLTLAAAVWMLEVPAVAALTAPPFWMLVAWRRQILPLRAVIRRGFVMICSTLIIVAGFVSLYTRAGNGSGHSTANVDTHDLVARSIGYLQRADWLTISPAWGRSVFKSALVDGWHTAASSASGQLLMGLVLASLLAAAAVLRNRRAPKIRLDIALILVAWGLSMATLTMLLPAVLITNVQVEYRLLYIPGIGLCVAVGVALSLIATRAFGRAAIVVLVMVVGMAMVTASVAMVGAADAYAGRGQLDAAEAAAFRRALPMGQLPAEVVLVPVDTEPQQRSTTFGMMLIGLFNHPFVGRGVIDPLYPNTKFQWVDMNYWSGIAFDRTDTGGLVEAGGVPLSPDRSVVFTYRDGKIVLIDAITLDSTDGTRTSYAFSLARRLNQGRRVAVTVLRGAAVLSLPTPDPALGPS
jgi:hypothetical protein